MLHDDLVTEGAYAHATLCMPISACPYEIGTQHWCAWREGWKTSFDAAAQAYRDAHPQGVFPRD